MYGGVLAISYLTGDGRWRFDLSVMTLTGPSIALMPHIEVRAMEGLYVDAGVQMIEGPDPGINGSTTGP